MNNTNYEHIPQEKFAFVQLDATLHDKKLETKSRSYLGDAFLRFRKNKSSVAAAWILLFLVLFAILSPILSPYDAETKNGVYQSLAPFWRPIAELNIGILDGAKTRDGQTETSMTYWQGIYEETGYNPVIKTVSTTTEYIKYRGGYIEYTTSTIKTNGYYESGVLLRTFSVADFEKIQAWQNETGIQVIYPYVEYDRFNKADNQSNKWYVLDSSGNALLDEDGNFQPNYSTNTEKAGAEYNSIRIEGDDGSYIYSWEISGAGVECRVCYYNYYQYLYGREPMYLLGTTVSGQDLFAAIGAGARFSLIFAICVSVINLTIGAIYGAIQGYYGGVVDMVLDRISDILSGIPFVVVATLFQLHLAEKVGVLLSFMFAFVMTGWIGMSSLTRKQFYRFKSQEFVMAARTLGASDRRLMFKHIFPNGLGTIITSCALVIPGVISSETNLTYLGIVDLSSIGTTLGILLNDGKANLEKAPHALLWPSLFLALMMISFNLFGNGLRDAFNPTTRGADE